MSSVYSTVRCVTINLLMSSTAVAATSYGHEFVKVTTTETQVEHHETPVRASLQGGFTLAHVGFTAFKSVVGPAVLYNPHVFALGGYIFGGAAILVAYMLWARGVYGLLELNIAHGGAASYEDLAVLAFGARGKPLVEVSIVLQQLGITISYFIFVASTVHASGFQCATWVVIMGMALLEVPLAILQSLEHLKPSILFATLLCAVALLWLIGSILWDLIGAGADQACEPLTKVSWSLAVGSAVFAFEGSAALALPVHNAVREDLRETGAKVYVCTVAGIALFYCLFGSAGYFLYGPKVEVIVINALPNVWTTQVVRIVFAVMVFLTYPFQLFPALTIISRWLLGAQAKDPRLVQLLRAVSVVGFGALGYVLRYSLDHLTAMIGSMLGIPLSFIYPALIHWQLAPQTVSTKARHSFVIAFGICSMSFTTYINFSTWSDSRS